MRYLDREPPKRLYHYTTATGLLGILKEKKIWATHTQYLNDLLEFRHAIGIVQDELAVMKDTSQDRDCARILEKLQKNTKGIERANVCVTSFSEDRDSLSQWRAYCGAGAGFSIGFSGEFLTSALDDDCFLMPCLYDEDRQRIFVRSILERVMRENEGSLKDHDASLDASTVGAKLNAHLLAYAAMLKHPSFKGEREWRISGLFNCERFEYRPGSSMIIPYYSIPLDADGVPFRIEEVVVGPAPYPEQSSRSVESLLLKCGLTDVRVDMSTVPYRNW